MRIFSYWSRDKKSISGEGKLCTQSYFVETIANANEDVIRHYAQNQLSDGCDEARFEQLFLSKTWSLAAFLSVSRKNTQIQNLTLISRC